MEFLFILVPIALIAWLVIGNVVNDRKEAKRNQEQKPSDSKVNTNVIIGGGGADNACDSDSDSE